MNKSKFKKYFSKIKSFEKWMEIDEELSKIELALLSDYIKKLYESVIEIDVMSNQPAVSDKTPAKKKDFEIKSEITKEDNFDNDISLDSGKETENTILPKNDISEDKKEIKEKKKPKIYSDEFLNIFSNNGSNELSEKLSLRPLSNLKKAFGINEKIFTINELFNGEKSEFNSAIDKLNSFNDFEEAKQYILDELTPAYEWDKNKKIKKVEHFVKTIMRRYIK